MDQNTLMCSTLLLAAKKPRWNVHEFLDAVESPDFFNNVNHVLDTDLSSDASASPGDLVLSKLYFAGDSARWMFLFPTRHDGNYFDRPFLKELI
jgi:hypothetical protein